MPLGEDIEIKPGLMTRINSNPEAFSWLDNTSKEKYVNNDFKELQEYFGLLQFSIRIKYDFLKDAYTIDIRRKYKQLATLEFKSITENTAIDVMNFIINNFLTFKDYNTMMKRQEASAREHKIKF